MKIVFCSLGKPHDSYVRHGIEDFSKRINNYFKVEWEIIPPVKNAGKLSLTDLKKAEAVTTLSKLNKDDFLVALDERGAQVSSEGLSELIQRTANNSARRMVFLIGGAYGIDETLLSRANFQWSLSKLVFPHQLVRLILSEQVYRACTILKNEKYHHQ
ncbi:MAG TPA: 23S rRNA (pseudouridine(1915)-N(3))-methyltransferase RlmH [Niabella sp.]|nr:23S rRNA (pseudouridine(1915)-N(3))-methyltransferase RlmH [Niabella sp.]HQW14934.1 23S rRNA (pseudouridine(1915)-N(3))-methyltransferase RlmH [Niabella sp.]HQX20174.1 23S rRNA (pseudouridine(1915)-N(3))-methyltransferase RlmH [Niabella sp.]HQX41930.1 23S rRNA (pseudouridine(1915)-N(3))-methyltransferase RlmH [Niabella sp.]HRB06779.1 23S rRNA (pseudouridine(1915)-N(3))-methyltransferase RlmH [Niabella sp.]